MKPIAPVSAGAVAGGADDATVSLDRRLAGSSPDLSALGARLLEQAAALDARDTERAVAVLFAETGRLLAEASPAGLAGRAARLAVAGQALAQAGASGAGESAVRLLRALELTLIAQDRFLLDWSQRLGDLAVPDGDGWRPEEGGRW